MFTSPKKIVGEGEAAEPAEVICVNISIIYLSLSRECDDGVTDFVIYMQKESQLCSVSSDSLAYPYERE